MNDTVAGWQAIEFDSRRIIIRDERLTDGEYVNLMCADQIDHQRSFLYDGLGIYKSETDAGPRIFFDS